MAKLIAFDSPYEAVEHGKENFTMFWLADINRGGGEHVYIVDKLDSDDIPNLDNNYTVYVKTVSRQWIKLGSLNVDPDWGD